MPTDTVYLPDEQGVLRPVPANASLEKYLEFLRANQKVPAGHGAVQGVPKFSVNDLHWSGIADDERATFTGEISVSIPKNGAADEHPILVPLAMHEAILVKAEHQGDGSGIYDGFDKSQGHRWWFTGSGKHLLKLELVIPIRKQVPQRKLSLSLPSSATGSLEFTVPFEQIVLKVAEPCVSETKSLDSKQTRVRILGLGNRVEAIWQPLTVGKSGNAQIDVHTQIFANLSIDHADVRAEQVLRPAQGALKEFTVSLPHGAELKKPVECDELLEQRIDPKSPEKVTVILAEARTLPVRVTWSVRIPWKPNQQPVLDGFLVEKSRKQSGEIRLSPVDGLRLLASEVNDPNLDRILPEETGGVATASAATRAYRFSNQPFKLPFSLEAIRPYFICEPRFAVLLEGDQLELSADFPVRVFRGAISDLKLRWPDWNASGWQIDSISPLDLVEGIEYDDSNREEVRVNLVNPQKEKFSVQLRARRSLRGSSPNFVFPNPVTSNTLPASIAVFLAENVEGTLSPAEGNGLRPLVSLAGESFWPNEWKALRKTLWKLGDQPVASWSAHVSEHPRQVRATTELSVELLPAGLKTQQEIDLQVKYDRLAQITLNIPAEMTEPIRWRLADGRLLPPPARLNPGGTQWRLTLPEPVLGSLKLIAESSMPMGESDQANTVSKRRISLIRLLETDYAEVRFAPRDLAGRQLQIESPGWQKLLTDASRFQWTAAANPASIEVQLVPWQRDGKTWTISRTWVRCIVNETGDRNTWVAYRVQGGASWLGFALPEHAQLSMVRWNGQPIPLDGRHLLDSKAGIHGIPRQPGDSATESLLELEFQQSSDANWGWNNLREIQVPHILESVSAAEIVWQVAVPGGQYLFDYDQTVTPLFRWQRVGWLWGRVPDTNPEQLQHWMGLAGENTQFVPSSNRNTYAFSQFGIAESLRIRTWSLPLVVLTGFGVSMFLGFLVLNLSAVQNVYGFLGLALLVTLASVMFRPQCELLLQPILTGSIVPLVVGLWERRKKRNRFEYPDGFPASSQLDFLDNAPSQEAAFRADQSTVLRRPDGSPGTSASIESGSGVA